MRSWLRWLIALTPVFPPLYLVSFLALKYWRSLDVSVRRLLLFYLFAQAAAALLSPNPWLSLPLALLRGGYVIALLLAGVYLYKPERLTYLLWGMTAIYLSSFFSSYYAFGERWWRLRLLHPYYTTTAIGLIGALGLLLLIEWKASWWLRLPVAVLAAGALLLSGSRGALALLVVGGIMAVLARGRRYAWGLAVGGVSIATAYVVVNLSEHIYSLSHFFSLNLSGRDRLWKSAIAAIKTHPWGGVGPYQLGPWIMSNQQSCHLWWGAARLFHLSCPAWLKPFSGSWIIAHNLLLHSLAETGVIGTVGFFALLALIGYATIKAREPFLIAVFFGYLTMSLVDNPMAVPSLFFAEVFWVAGGMALAQAGLAVPLEQGLAVDQDQLGPDAL